MKQILKNFIPNELWRRVREFLIIREHKKVARVCDALFKENERSNNVTFKAKRDFGDKHIIWQYWGQGYEQVPELVGICLKSVEKYKNNCEVVRLSDENLSDYIDLPDFIVQKKEIFPRPFFSDLLRCILLSTYGGVWLDATVLLTGALPEWYFEQDFFLFQRDKDEPNQSYWESCLAHYYGWHKDFKVKMLSSIFFAKKDSLIVEKLTQLLLVYWKNETHLHHYFFLQILFNQLIEKNPEYNCPIESDCTPHILQQIINTGYQEVTFDEAVRMSNIHKLTYKDPHAAARLKALLEERA